MIEGDHMISDEDAGIITRWVGNQDPDTISTISRNRQKN